MGSNSWFTQAHLLPCHTCMAEGMTLGSQIRLHHALLLLHQQKISSHGWANLCWVCCSSRGSESWDQWRNPWHHKESKTGPWSWCRTTSVFMNPSTYLLQFRRSSSLGVWTLSFSFPTCRIIWGKVRSDPGWIAAIIERKYAIATTESLCVPHRHRKKVMQEETF